MDARTGNTYGRHLIIRFALLVAIGVLSFAQPSTGLGQEPCEITTPSPGMTCAECDNDGDGCWGAACCSRVTFDEDFVIEGVKYKCSTSCGCGDDAFDTCEQ